MLLRVFNKINYPIANRNKSNVILRVFFSSNNKNDDSSNGEKSLAFSTNKSVVEKKRRKQSKSLIEKNGPFIVKAKLINTPIFPGLQMFRHIDPREEIDAKPEKMAYFMPRKKITKKITSLEDIYTVGTYCVETVSPYKFIGNLKPHVSSPQIFFKRIKSIRAVKAIAFKKGFVTVEEYGKPEVYNLACYNMEKNLRALFEKVQNIILRCNRERVEIPEFSNVESNLNVFKFNNPAETASDLRALLAVLFPENGEELQKILEIKNIKSLLEAIKKTLDKHQSLIEYHKELRKRMFEKMALQDKNLPFKIYVDIIEKKANEIENMLSNPEEEKKDSEKTKKEEENFEKFPKHVREFLEKTKVQILRNSKNSGEREAFERQYEFVSSYPWGNKTKDNFDLNKAQKIMDEDHHGLKEVKERIIEFIATGKMKGKISKGKIICFVGPPGVGKTSMGRSIARALGRKFTNISVGGLDDANEINGHRKTYIGAMPGRIVNGVKKAGSENPLFLIDEIDKIGRGYKGDPSAVLLGVLDPSQNNEFTDNYMEVSVDLSDVLFICTANNKESIIGPLADRMEFIEIPGYTAPEKLSIAKNFLSPKTLKETGLGNNDVDLSENALRNIIRWYCREAGVRQLERAIQKIMRKVCVRILRDKEKMQMVDESNLEKYLGKKRFLDTRYYEKTPVGVAMGLSYSEMGGSPLYVETNIIGQNEKKSPKFEATGRLGKVMNESIRIAINVAQNFLKSVKGNSKDKNKEVSGSNVDEEFFLKNLVHLHFPEGAIKKEGPSAGIAIACALVSLALKTPVARDVCMTGELTLSGQVLPIGGVKEKVYSAMEAKAKEVILPEGNKSDWEELDKDLKEKLVPRFVKNSKEVFKITFPAMVGGL